MSDYSAFKWGAVQYPLPASGSGIGGTGASLLRDADPALFFVLEYYKAVLETHLSTRFMAEVAAANANSIASIVNQTLPFNPEPYLTEDHVGFPLLAAYRKSSKPQDIGGQKLGVDEIEVVWVMPPLRPGEAERLMPIQKAVAAVIDNRTEQGMDPAYTPNGGTLGQSPWALAGLTSAEVKSVEYGFYAATESMFFPSVLMKVELKERSDVAVATFDVFSGIDANIDVANEAEPTVQDFVQVAVYPPPTVTVASPNSGSKVGGTVVTFTCIGLIPGRPYTITFGSIPATNVTVLDATHIRCSSPAHSAYPTAIVDVEVIDDVGQVGLLVAGYTYTTP